MAHHRAGSSLILVLMVTVGLLSLAGVGLVRSATETAASQAFLAKQQAFYFAEAGIDAAITDASLQGPFTLAEITDPATGLIATWGGPHQLDPVGDLHAHPRRERQSERCAGGAALRRHKRDDQPNRPRHRATSAADHQCV